MLLVINPDHPEPRKIERAALALAAGEIIAYPTDTLYGLGCDLSNKRAIERLSSFKPTPKGKQFSFICPNLGDIAKYALVENATYRLLRHLLPGPYTFILNATRDVPRIVQSKRKTVGIRVPKHPVPVALAAALGRPILSTSATDHMGVALIDTREIDDSYHGLAMVLDGGTGGEIPTTIIDLTRSPVEIVREGAGAIDEFI